MKIISALGRRKEAVARVFLKLGGSGKISINQREWKSYFRSSSSSQYIVQQPLNVLGITEKYDIEINLKGGGYKVQSEAVRLGIARALIKVDPENKPLLRSEGFLTRDPREVERKKPGRPKARKKFQFSKR